MIMSRIIHEKAPVVDVVDSAHGPALHSAISNVKNIFVSDAVARQTAKGGSLHARFTPKRAAQIVLCCTIHGAPLSATFVFVNSRNGRYEKKETGARYVDKRRTIRSSGSGGPQSAMM